MIRVKLGNQLKSASLIDAYSINHCRLSQRVVPLEPT